MVETNNKVKILVIAPYIGLMKLFEEAVSKRDNIELTAYVSDTTEAVALVKTLPMNNYDIIISRGYTCKMIQAVCKRHVLNVGISIYDVLRTIRLAQNYNGRFAVVGFHSIIYYAIVLKDVLRYNFDIYTIRATDEIEGKLKQLKEIGYTMIVGDVITTQLAKSIGLQTMLITTSPESVEAILDNSLSLYEELLSLKWDKNFYKELIYGMDDGLAVYDTNEHLLFSHLLEQETLKKVLKKSVTVLFEKKEMRYIKTIETTRFFIHGKLMSLAGQEIAVFYFRALDKRKKENGLLKFHDSDSSPAVSQRTFYTLSPALKSVLSEIKAFQFFSRPVLIIGPRGSGKDSFAFFLYKNSSHQKNPMAIIDCKFAEAREWDYLVNHEDSPLYGTGYTLFFKDVQHLNEQQQGQLYTLLCNTALHKRNQLIFSYIPGCSYSFDRSSLKNEILNILQSLTITIPSLNERREDIPNLATLYLSEFNSEMAKQAIAFEPDALNLLQDFNWTDNLYQLRSVIQELILCAESSFITESEVKKVLKKYETETIPAKKANGISLDGSLDDIIKQVIHQVLKEENMNQSSAAKRLKIGRSTLRRHLL